MYVRVSAVLEPTLQYKQKRVLLRPIQSTQGCVMCHGCALGGGRGDKEDWRSMPAETSWNTALKVPRSGSEWPCIWYDGKMAGTTEALPGHTRPDLDTSGH